MINLNDILFKDKVPFCIINTESTVSIFKGEIREYDLIKDLPAVEKQGINYIAILPYCQIKERGYETIDEGEKIIAFLISQEIKFPLDEFLQMLPDDTLEIDGEFSYNLNDVVFTEKVDQIIKNEINNGEGSNFLFSRKTKGKIKEFKPIYLLSILKRLMVNELNSYWNFLFYSVELSLIGSSPERHLTYEGSKLTMNPICGTIPKFDGHNLKERLVEFIQNPKEINELFQVVDEELKIVCKLCPDGGKIRGPFLKEMGSLIHTEYFLEGKGDVDIFWGLKESLYAATMIGSPLESAARVIKKYENESRRYYSSLISCFGMNKNNEKYIDSAITIRTMEIDTNGRFVIQCGASIVRDSVPELECLEINTKASGLIKAMFVAQKKKTFLPDIVDDNIIKILNSRNNNLSTFWFKEFEKTFSKKNQTIVFIDNEDDFIYMLSHMMTRLGYETLIVRYDHFKIEDYNSKEHLVVIGPGPGNPNDLGNYKIKILFDITKKLLNSDIKVLGICLGHQIISKTLGFTLTKSIIPSQGMQKNIVFMGKKQYVGFYNSFFAINDINMDYREQGLQVEFDDDEKIIYIKGEKFVSFQFHVESILTQNGIEILEKAMNYLL